MFNYSKWDQAEKGQFLEYLKEALLSLTREDSELSSDALAPVANLTNLSLRQLSDEERDIHPFIALELRVTEAKKLDPKGKSKKANKKYTKICTISLGIATGDEPDALSPKVDPIKIIINIPFDEDTHNLPSMIKGALELLVPKVELAYAEKGAAAIEEENILYTEPETHELEGRYHDKKGRGVCIPINNNGTLLRPLSYLNAVGFNGPLEVGVDTRKL